MKFDKFMYRNMWCQHKDDHSILASMYLTNNRLALEADTTASINLWMIGEVAIRALYSMAHAYYNPIIYWTHNNGGIIVLVLEPCLDH